jgi:hypothetical protein
METYIHRNGEQFGPYTDEQLLEMLDADQIHKDDLVWEPAAEAWENAGEYILKRRKLTGQRLFTQRTRTPAYLILPCDLWVAELPDPPKHLLPLEYLTEQQYVEFQHGLDLVNFFRQMPLKPWPKRLNSLAQRRWPERTWKLQNTMCVVEAWRTAGLVALAQLVAQGRNRKGLYPAMVHNRISTMLAMKVSWPEDQPVYLLPDDIHPRYVSAPKPYLVRAKAKFGLYSFFVACSSPPQLEDPFLEEFCIHQNWVGPAWN